MTTTGTSAPPTRYNRSEIIERSVAVLGRPDIKITTTEEIFRIAVLGLDWDLGAVILRPENDDEAAVGPDGKRIGVFLLHGGSGDFKSFQRFGTMLASKFGYTVLLGTFPGRFYFPDPQRDWPGDTISDDGSVRTPIWKIGEVIGRDEYEVVKDESLRARYGIRTLARAKPGTNFYDRMAAWPAAFEEGMVEANRRYLPASDYSVYGEGHSTGGPFICMLSQRIPNMVGVVATEHSPFGDICRARDAWGGPLGKIAGYDKAEDPGEPRTDKFYDLYIRTWRDIARYAGPEALGQEGPGALMRLPWLMEDVLSSWERARRRPQFKAEYIVTHGVTDSLAEAATVTARRLGLGPDETDHLVQRFRGYTHELSGPGVKPVPPFLISISKDSRDHSPEVYEEVILPALAAMKPAPKVHLARYDAGVHSFWKAEPDLPFGIAPAVATHWQNAIMSGFFAG